MKNMIELPTEKDFHKTTVIEQPNFNQPMYVAPKQSELILYRKANVNMRNIVDILEYEIVVDVLDESKFDEYKIKLDEFRKKRSLVGDTFPVFPDGRPVNEDELSAVSMDMPPICPTKEFRLKCTLVMYFNGIQRMLVDDFSEFSQLYFEYLQKQQLDLRN